MKRAKCEQFDDRVRFNWGFHDAAYDAARNEPRITHSMIHDVRHVSPSFDKAYHDGYEHGLEYMRLNLATNSSEPAWQSRERGFGRKAV